MKEYRFEEISLGLSESFQVEITREMMEKFRDISGDVNPLHNDTEFAKARGYEDRIADIYAGRCLPAGEILPDPWRGD